MADKTYNGAFAGLQIDEAVRKVINNLLMEASIYDPKGKATDIFKYVDEHTPDVSAPIREHNESEAAHPYLQSLIGGKVGKELLWQNASPSSDFAAQDIVIPEMANSNVGDFIFIDTYYGTIVSAWSATQKQWLYPSCVQHENNAMVGRGRNFQLLNDTITVENGKQFADGTFVNTAYNNWLKPLKIWRLRTEVQE